MSSTNANVRAAFNRVSVFIVSVSVERRSSTPSEREMIGLDVVRSSSKTETTYLTSDILCISSTESALPVDPAPFRKDVDIRSFRSIAFWAEITQIVVENRAMVRVFMILVGYGTTVAL